MQQAGMHLHITGTLTVAADGAIRADGRGFTGGNGPGGFPFNGGGRSGASYGGRGGDRARVNSANLCYGSVTAPTDLGTGGNPIAAAPGGPAGALRISARPS